MAAKAGEKAWKTGTFVCQVCDETVRARKGQAIPECPNGHTTFAERIDEPPGERPLQGARRRRVRTAGTSARRSTGGKTSTRKRVARGGRKSERKAARRGKTGPRRKTASRRKPVSRKRRTQR